MKLLCAMLVAGLCVPVGTGQPVASEVLLLARVKAKAKQALADVPAYACSETMERFTRRSGRFGFQRIDEVKLEVAEIGGKELFAKAGSKAFEDRGLQEMVGSGLIATGMFYHLAKTLVGGAAAQFTYAEHKKLKGHPSVQFNFIVSSVFAGYQLDFNYHKAQCGMRGSVWADENSLDLIRIRIEATEIPLALRVKQAVTEIDYGRAALGGQSFLIPASSEITIVNATGQEDRAAVKFSNCRKYGVESTLSFQ